MNATRTNPPSTKNVADIFSDMPDDDFGDYKAPEQVVLYREDCKKCHGKGYIAVYGFRDQGVCYECDGKGYKEFKQPKEVRQRKTEQARASKAKRLDRKFAEFEAAHPDIAGWWTGSTFPFAVDLREKCHKYEGLTEGQIAAAKKCAAKFAEVKAARVAVIKAAPAVDISGLERAFEKARNNGLMRVKLRLLGNDIPLLFFPASDHAKAENQGAIYVKDDRDGAYLGKILNGKFMRSRDCSDEQNAAVLDACAAPEDSAVAYGKRFGACSCCGRLLSNALSIQLGIGPICRSKFFS
jgi:hypothetical protein